MNSLISYKGIIHFDPIDLTNKHKSQSDWKRIALVLFDGEICEYYSWFIKRRYNLRLNKPMRGAHISFINDSINDIKSGLNCTEIEAYNQWNIVKEKWNNTEIDVVLNVDVRSSIEHWWMNVHDRNQLHNIRNELGLGRPFFGLHLSIGYANSKQIEHSEYIINCINKGFINS